MRRSGGRHHRQPPDRRLEAGARRRSGVPRALQGAGGDQHHAVRGLVHRRLECHEGATDRGGLHRRAGAGRRAARTGPSKATSIALLPGSDPKLKPLLLLAHIDVVEANRADWERDPFKLVEEDGFFYARGASDDKAMAAVFADMMVRYKQEGYRPKRGIKLALTCGEETPNVFNGVRYLIENHRDLIDAGIRAQRRRRRPLRPADRRVSIRRGARVRKGLPGLHAVDQRTRAATPRARRPTTRSTSSRARWTRSRRTSSRSSSTTFRAATSRSSAPSKAARKART